MAMDSCSATPTGIPVVVLQAALAALVHRSRCLLSAGGSDSCWLTAAVNSLLHHSAVAR